MKTSNAIVWLAWLIAVLALGAAGAGLFWPHGGRPFPFTTLRGEAVSVYGEGLYRYDTLFIGAGYRGQDAVVLALGIPLLVCATWLYRRGSLRGGLLLVGMLGYFLYVYASMALGAAYNELFLVYVALFSASLFAFVRAFAAVDLPALADRLASPPRRSLAVFLFAGGLVTLVVWGGPLMAALAAGEPPALLASYTTMVTYALDLAIVAPATFLSGALVRRREPLGYLIAVPLLVIIALLAPQIVLSTYFQQAAGVAFTTGEIVGPVAGFIALGLVAVWLLVTFFRSVAEDA